MRWLVNHCKMSVMRACRLVGLARASYYYEARARVPVEPDPEIRQAVLDVCRERPSFGSRRVMGMVRRRLGRQVNRKGVRRIMALERLTLRSGAQPPRRRIPKRPGRILTERPDMAWQSDGKYVPTRRDGHVVLQSIVDTCTGEWISYVFDKRYRKQEAVQLLERAVLARWPATGRAPGTRLRLDNARCYTSDLFVETAKTLGFQVEFIQVHTPEDNGMVESFHAGLDRDYLDLHEFESKEDAARFIETAFVDYNEEKPKERLGWKTPREAYKELKENVKSIVVESV